MPEVTSRGQLEPLYRPFFARYAKLCTAHGAAARSSVNVIGPWLVVSETLTVPVFGVDAGSVGRPTSLLSGDFSSAEVSAYLQAPVVAFGLRDALANVWVANGDAGVVGAADGVADAEEDADGMGEAAAFLWLPLNTSVAN